MIPFITIHFSASSMMEKIQNTLEEIKDRTLYYKPYMVSGALMTGGVAIAPRYAAAVLGITGIYGLYEWKKGYDCIEGIYSKYNLKTMPHTYWNDRESNDQRFLFCRWRQKDDQYGDGMYWSTAWWMNEYRTEVKRKLIHDAYAGRLILFENNKSIEMPNPVQVFQALKQEMKMLHEDKKKLKRYTIMCYDVDQPEAFHPDASYWSLLWPNYNKASQLYIEIVMMLRRLDILQEIIAEIRAEVGGNGWPQPW